MKGNIRTAQDSGFLGNTAITYSSDLVSALLGFVSVVLIARTIGPAGYGVFAISIAVMGIAYELSDFGLDPGTVKFAAPLYLKDGPRYRRVVLASLRIRFLVSTAVLIAGASLSWAISDALTDDGQGTIAVALAFVGAFTTSLFAHTRAVLQCEKMFRTLAVVRVGTTGGTTVILIALILIGILTPPTAILGYAATPLASFAMFQLLRRDQREDRTDVREDAESLLRFSRWMFAITILSVVFLRLDVIFLGAFWTEAEVGVYSVALTLVFPVTQLANSIVTVLMPDISAITTKSALYSQMRKVSKVTLAMAAILLAFAATALPDELIPLVFGDDFSESAEPFKILCITASAMLIAKPFYLAAYPIDKPKILFHGDFVKLVLHTSAYAILVPTLGVMGAAWGSAAAMGFGSAISVALVFAAVQKSPDVFPPTTR